MAKFLIYRNSNSSATWDCDYITIPEHTTVQRDALTVSNGSIIYNTTTNQLERYNGATWESISGGDNIYNSDGTITALRTVDFNGNSLIFQSGIQADNMVFDVYLANAGGDSVGFTLNTDNNISKPAIQLAVTQGSITSGLFISQSTANTDLAVNYGTFEGLISSNSGANSSQLFFSDTLGFLYKDRSTSKEGIKYINFGEADTADSTDTADFSTLTWNSLVPKKYVDNLGNIYTTDGTLLSNRTVDTGGFNLLLQNTTPSDDNYVDFIVTDTVGNTSYLGIASGNITTTAVSYIGINNVATGRSEHTFSTVILNTDLLVSYGTFTGILDSVLGVNSAQLFTSPTLGYAYRDKTVGKFGIRYVDFGESDINDSTDAADFSTLVWNSLVPKKYVDNLFASNIIQGGNTFGAAVRIGSNDPFDLEFETNNELQASFRDSDNAFVLINNVVGREKLVFSNTVSNTNIIRLEGSSETITIGQNSTTASGRSFVARSVTGGYDLLNVSYDSVGNISNNVIGNSNSISTRLDFITATYGTIRTLSNSVGKYGVFDTDYRFVVEPDNTLTVGNTANYESLVTNNNDIPNRKFVTDLVATINTEFIQDAAFSALTDTATIDLTYNDGLNQVTADVINDSITNLKLANMAANTVKVNATNATASPQDLSMTTDTILGRVQELNSGNLTPIPIQRMVVGQATLTNGSVTVFNASITVSSIAFYTATSTGTLSAIPLRATVIAGQCTFSNGQIGDNALINYQIYF